MNRIETKIVVMISNRLAAAKDSEAKTELIEELSENLYQRYLDLTADGLSEEEALKQAMENLGDTDELLAYLESEEEENTEESGKEEASQGWDWTGSFSSNLENGIEDMVNMALSTARVAVDCAKDVVRDVSDQIREKYPNGASWQFTSEKSRKVDCTAIPSEVVHSLDIRLTNGDVSLLFTDDEAAPIEITGDTEAIETLLREDGILSVKQGNTASTSILFTRGIMASDIDITLPRRFWNNISITAANGDIRIEDGLECKALAVQTTSGDLDVSNLACERMVFRMVSGDISGESLTGDLYAETKSGDIDITGRLEKCSLMSISGDIGFEGEAKEMNCTSTSGDIDLKLCGIPEKTKAATKSGDCSVWIPSDTGFRLSYRTVSGEFDTNLTLNGVYKGKNGEASHLDGGSREIQISSISGDLGIWSHDEPLTF